VADARKEAGDAGLLKDKSINPIQHKKDEEAKIKAEQLREYKQLNC
jgi:hypothetical protein